MMRQRAYYFGDLRGDGHFLCSNSNQRGCSPLSLGMPWELYAMDGVALVVLGQKEPPDGTVRHVYRDDGAEPWHAFVWWDRSGDARWKSNSGLYVAGFGEFAKSAWPDVVKRQQHPLVLKLP